MKSSISIENPIMRKSSKSSFKNKSKIFIKFRINATQLRFTTSLSLPLGQVSYCLIYYSKEDKNDDFKAVKLDEATLKQNPKNVFEVSINPNIPSKSTTF